MSARWLKRRRLIDDVPDLEFLGLLGGKFGVESRVEPVDQKWEWRVWLTFGRGPSLAGYMPGSWRKEGPHEVRGRCRQQWKAEKHAREAVEDVRVRYAAKQFEQMRRKSGGNSERIAL